MTPTEYPLAQLRPARINGRLVNLGRIYYYQGNFFYPLDLCKENMRIVKVAIFQFMQKNRALVLADRADPEYKTLVELAGV